jgi:protein O-GlcNAc transferase
LQVESADSFGWFLLGACRHALDDLRGAETALACSLNLNPQNLEANLARISVLRAMSDARGALAAAQQAGVRFPRNARVLYAIALTFEDLGLIDRALEGYRSALEHAPDFAEALHNRGLLLARLGQYEAAESSYKAFVAAHPDSVPARLGQIDVLIAQARYDDAIGATEALQALAPDDVGVWIRRGVVLASVRRYSEAKLMFDEALKKDTPSVMQILQRVAPNSNSDLMLSPHNLYLWQAHLALERCDWRSWFEYVEEFRASPSAPAGRLDPAITFVALHLPLSGAERHALARHIASGIEARAAPLPTPPARRGGRIRVGVLSPDFREHLNSYLLLPLFELLARDRFELFAYSLRASDGSAILEKLGRSADHFRDLQALSDEEAVASIRRDDIDVLIDVAGHTMGGNFAITARRPARLQVLYLGFAGSLGSTRVDYAIADRVVAGTLDEWSEELVHLPHTYYLYDFRAPCPQVRAARVDYGLREDWFVFCAFHKAEKISPDAFELWMRILARVPHSVLWLLALPDAAQRNLRRAAERHGVNAARLVFAPFDSRERYLARQRLGDLMLDTIHHSAMTTACDAMAAALPVLTIKGAAMASRAGESLTRAAGLPELVAPDKEAYVEMAVALASDPQRLAGYRRTLQERRGPLFDTAGRVREIEVALLEMWRRHLAQR